MNRRIRLLCVSCLCAIGSTLVAQTAAPFGITGKNLHFNKTDSVYMCSIGDSLFAGDYRAQLYIDSAVVDSVWSKDAAIQADSIVFPLVEGNKHYQLFLRKLDGDTLRPYITFTSMPIVALEGTFGYEYEVGVVSISMPSDEDRLSMQARIKWRGGTTNAANKHKRNYKLKFIDEAGEKQENSFFGFREDNEWILNAGQVDLARCRNQIAHDLWYDIARKPYYADKEPKALTCVRGEFVEVLLNNEYRGIYSMSECMDRKQMKLKKYNEETGTTRGQLWKTTSWDGTGMHDIAPYDNTKETWRGFETQYPDFEDVNPTDYATLYDAIAFVVNSSDADFAANVENYFDVPVLLDYYIFLSVLVARDNNGKNMYWGCYDQTTDKKLTLAVWDLDCTIGQNYTDTDPHPDGFAPTYEMSFMRPLARLLKIPAYQYEVLQRYKELYPQYLNAESLKSRYVSVMEHFMRCGAATRESEKWSGDTDIAGLTLDFEEELDFITDWIDKRISFLDNGEFLSTPSLLRPTTDDNQNETVYTLLGQPVSAPNQGGIYIIKGKKVLVK